MIIIGAGESSGVYSGTSGQNRCGVHRAVKVYYCGACDVGYSKETFRAHLVRYLHHKNKLTVFDSGIEFAYFRELLVRKKAGDISDFWIHPQYNVYLDFLNKKLWGSWKWHQQRTPKGSNLLFYYKPDFVIFFHSTQQIAPTESGLPNYEWIDVKGQAKKGSKKT